MISIESINYLEFNELNNELLDSYANLYCEIWREPPWNELFWKPESVLVDLEQQIIKQDSCAFFSTNSSKDKIVGFTWGYAVNLQELTEMSSGANFEEFVSKDERIFYIDELGVEKNHRNLGVGKRLSLIMIDEIRARSFSKVVLRTNMIAIPARKLYCVLGFTELSVRDLKYTDRTYWLLKL